MALHKQLLKACLPLKLEVHLHTYICTFAGGDVADTKDRTKQKACLERYRKACIEILGVLNKAAPQARRLLQCHA